MIMPRKMKKQGSSKLNNVFLKIKEIYKFLDLTLKIKISSFMNTMEAYYRLIIIKDNLNSNLITIQ